MSSKKAGTTVSKGQTMCFEEVLALVGAVGNAQTIVVEGQPGIGKTAMANILAKRLKMNALVVDCATMVDGGDVTIPWMEQGVFTHKPNSMFGTHADVPMVICLDEIGKANKSVIAAITPILRDHKVAGIPLPAGSIVYATSNNVSDMVGDNIPAHIWNGVTAVQMRNPTVDEWLDGFAYESGVSGEIIAWLKQNPQAFDHYSEYASPNDNPLIFDPRDVSRRQYVSPRSLERLSRVLDKRDELGTGAVAAVAGTIGLSAAHDLMTMVHLSDTLPSLDAVMANPMVTPPKRGVAQMINCLNLVTMATRAEDRKAILAVTEYVTQFEAEIQALFVSVTHKGAHLLRWTSGNQHMVALATRTAHVM